MNNGGTWFDPVGNFGPNYAACIQLLDATHGAACAAAFNNANGCNGYACDTACMNASNNAYDNCLMAASTGACMQYAATETSACAADSVDGGAEMTCAPGMGNRQDPDFQFILTLICGGGDAGSADGGDAGSAEGGVSDAGIMDGAGGG